MALSKINIPNKVPTSLLEADEVNLLVTTTNAIIDAVEEPSHAFSSEHFVQDGVENVNGVAVPVIKIKLDPAYFEIVNGLIRPKL